MVAFRMLGRREIEVETQACIARIDYDYEPGFVFVNLFDKRLSEHFVIMMRDDERSRKKLEKLINEGVSEEEAEFLRIVRSFSSPETQACYFEKFAKGELTLESALRDVKRNKKVHMRFMAAKYLKEVERRFRLVCEMGRSWAGAATHEVLYGEAGGSRLVLFVRKDVIRLLYAMVIGDSEVTVYYGDWRKTESITRWVFKHVVDGGREWERLLRGAFERESFKRLLDFLEEYEQPGRIVVHDRELYDYIKSLIAMNVIVA